MMRFVKIFSVCMILIASAMPVLGHGVRISYAIEEATGEITVEAAYDTGEVLAESQVIIFAPDDLINPWMVDTADENGTFSFMPDYEIEGFWEVQVRQAGHGGMVNVEITSEMMPVQASEADPLPTDQTATTVTMSDGSQIVITGDAQFQVEGDIIISASGDVVDASSEQVAPDNLLGNGFTPAQIVIMSISVIWGLIGTALYFARRKTSPEP